MIIDLCHVSFLITKNRGINFAKSVREQARRFIILEKKYPDIRMSNGFFYRETGNPQAAINGA